MRSKAKTQKILHILSVSTLLTALCSCIDDTRYINFISIKQGGWSHTDTLTYIVDPLSNVERCGISLLLHTEGYAYENIAFTITIKQDTTLLYHEQRSYLLKQHDPQNGIGRRCDYTLPIGNIYLCDTLPATITITQQLDQPSLRGIREVGTRISSPLRQPGEPVWKVDWH